MKVKNAEPALSNEKGAFQATLDVASVCANLCDTTALDTTNDFLRYVPPAALQAQTGIATKPVPLEMTL